MLRIVEFMVSRCFFRPRPAKKGIRWMVAAALPFTLHDLMIEFKQNHNRAAVALDKLRRLRYVIRKRKNTPPPPGAHKYEDRAVIRDGKKVIPAYRNPKSALYQYVPTHWGLMRFLRHHPEDVRVWIQEGNLWMKPVRSRQMPTYVKFLKTTFVETPAQREALRRKMRRWNLGITRNPIGLPPNRPPTV